MRDAWRYTALTIFVACWGLLIACGPHWISVVFTADTCFMLWILLLQAEHDALKRLRDKE